MKVKDSKMTMRRFNNGGWLCVMLLICLVCISKLEYESEMMRKITEVISTKLNRPPLHIADYPVGLKVQMQQIEKLMGSGEFDNKVTMLGIHGMGGIGKSTLSRAIHNLIAHQFESSHFLANVREKSSKDGLVHIQETMLSELVGEKSMKLGDVHRGIPILQQRLSRKKVLLVLDDISKKEQLLATAGGLDWFGPGSIIIITTRDKHLLDVHGVEKQYKVEEINDIEALELLKWNAFKNKEVYPCYKEVTKRAMYYANGLPLALETIGSNLFGKTLDEWESALEAYERIPNRDVQEVLRVSYDSLDAFEKEIFLDMACFFTGFSLEYVTNMLEARGFPSKFGIRVLEQKSLIKIRGCRHETVTMHDMIQSMGKEIVRQQSTLPHKRNRLWLYEDIVCVLEKNMENDKVEVMMLDMPEYQEMQCNQKLFGKMKNLRMILIKEEVGFLRSPTALPNTLRVLEWWGYPATSLPSNFHLKNLVILNLSHSYFGWDKPLENSKVLRQLILKGCKNIRRIPDMSGFPNLTELRVAECTNLIEIHESVGSLLNLQKFCAEGCTKLTIGPSRINLISLEHLCLRDCSSLVMFPEVSAPMQKLKYVDLVGTAIKNLPLSMQNLEGLQMLSLGKCNLLEINESPYFFQKLHMLFPNLTGLYLRDLDITILPACIEECHTLKFLYVTNCKKLQEIRGLPLSINEFTAVNSPVKANSLLTLKLRQAIHSAAIRIFVLPGWEIPKLFDHSSRGNSLSFWFRKELPSLAVCAIIGVWDNVKPPFAASFNFYVKLNDIYMCVSCFRCGNISWTPEDSHIIILNRQNDFQHPLHSDIQRALLTNEWIPGKILLRIESEKDPSRLGKIKKTGVYVNRTFSRVEDVRFEDPYAPNKASTMENKLVLLGEAPDLQQQQQRSPSLFNPTTPLESAVGEQHSYTVDSNNQDGEFLDDQPILAPSVAEMQNGKAQKEMSALISEVSSEFTAQSREIESTESQSRKVDEAEAGLETQNQFRSTMVLQNQIDQRLTRIRKMKEDLGEKLSGIKADISAIEANHSSIKANISAIKAIISADSELQQLK
ncbi:disease resistance protein RPV1-like isoform X2 [Phaseolus vulgaris]|uniref:disease resistance protein RPV1-like isoform X2 n=1 Tax=Phaseolus vulgaris TaxID=3885 RepID=UPI0035C96658